MASFRVKFVNRLTSSDGHPFKTLQRIVRVRSHSPEEAIEIAKRRFERLERIADWTLHAQAVEIECEEEATRARRKPDEGEQRKPRGAR